MRDRDEDRFRPKVGPPKARGHAPKSRFIKQVIHEAAKAGGARGTTGKSTRSRPGSRLGRGHVAAKLAGQNLGPNARRVVIKTRLVNLKKAHPLSTQKHLQYIAREGVTQDGARGRLYNAQSEEIDAEDFERRMRGDRHQFRFIVSPEDGAQIEDLKSFTRELMAQVERDLGTRLQWVAVDHWDTDNPHAHIVVRGRDDQGHDLIIVPGYLSHGMRARAEELATRWLGHRSELEIRESLAHEVTQDRWTSLDREIEQRAHDGVVTFQDDDNESMTPFRRSLLIGRLDYLRVMDLAEKQGPFTYRLSPRIETILRHMGERGDIIRTMQRAMGKQRREYVQFDHFQVSAPVSGRVAGSGLADELNDRAYLVVDGVDGRAHYITLSKGADINEFPTGVIVEARSAAEPRAADKAIKEHAKGGVYKTAVHLQEVRDRIGQKDPETFIAAHVRRLEALRRAGIVERIEEGVWRIPIDLPVRGQLYDAEMAGGARVELRSHLSLDAQVTAIGATWLDRQAVGKPGELATKGFGAEARAAIDRRADFLIEQGLAERRGQQVIYARNLLNVLKERELATAARTIETESGLTHRPMVDGRRVSGIYRRSVMLASGRFALLDDATGFSLVPWRPVVEQRLGQTMSAVVRGEFVSWEFGRRRDLSI